MLNLLECRCLKSWESSLQLGKMFNFLMAWTELLDAKTCFFSIPIFVILVYLITWLFLCLLLLCLYVPLDVLKFVLKCFKHLRITVVEEFAICLFHLSRHCYVICSTHTRCSHFSCSLWFILVPVTWKYVKNLTINLKTRGPILTSVGITHHRSIHCSNLIASITPEFFQI